MFACLNITILVPRGLFELGFSTYLEGSKVNHVIDVRVLAEDLVKCSLVVDIHLVKLRSLATDELDPVDDLL